MAFTMTTARKNRLKERARNINEIRSELPEGTGLFDLFNELQNKFDATGGHTHDGTSEDAPQLDIDDMSDVIHDHSANAEGGTIPNSSLDNPNSYFTMAIHHSETESGAGSVDPMASFQMPFAATLVEVSAHARTIDTADADETYSIDVEEAGTSVLSSAISISAADTTYVGTISDNAIADDAKIDLVLTLGGTTPSIDDVTVLLTFKTTHTT